ncbi:helix-turn-helix transcriptional regulator [Arsenicibacter rosenii]|uniref:Addiction module antidote protein, HigA family n=1 Tax=Arsenicibacter rosenii TaxID=1750698 RepID=A0A1S2VLY7_9BACT|nr:hypothetical protein [Arsenicibacter rosenii]OIN59772.1 hypothetical protein BLX24_07910 [Arsenicibacter rosenii]
MSQTVNTEIADQEPFLPDWSSKPGNTIKSVMLEKEITPGYLAKKLELSDTDFQKLLDAEIPVTPGIARLLSIYLGASIQFWINRQKHYEEALQSSPVINTDMNQETVRISQAEEDIKRRRDEKAVIDEAMQARGQSEPDETVIAPPAAEPADQEVVQLIEKLKAAKARYNESAREFNQLVRLAQELGLGMQIRHHKGAYSGFYEGDVTVSVTQHIRL